MYGYCKADCSGAGPSCGDGIPNGPEACDDGNIVDTDACLTTCVLAKCGDGVVEAGVESCDDGNGVAGDGCSPQCKFEIIDMSTGVTTSATGGGGSSASTTASGTSEVGGGSSASTTASGTSGVGGGTPGGVSGTEGGCGCWMAGGAEGPSSAWLLIATAIVVARRRRAGR
jgi:cysteine-rich repeat protein